MLNIHPSQRVNELYQVKANISFCQSCELHKTRKNTCPGNIKLSDDAKEFDWMFIGEAPGEQEDNKGKVFIGKSGQLLKKVVTECGFDNFFITNAIKCRPPQNRNPETSEILECGHFLVQQIDIVKPKVIICVGKVAIEALDLLFGKTMPYEYVTIWHPAYVLRQMSKYETWKQSLLNIKDRYGK